MSDKETETDVQDEELLKEIESGGEDLPGGKSRLVRVRQDAGEDDQVPPESSDR